MNWELIFKLGIGILGVATAVLVLIAKRKESKVRKAEAIAQEAGLAANPTRCLKHEERMSVMEEKALGALNTVNEHFSGMEKRLDIIGGDVKALLNVHIKS